MPGVKAVSQRLHYQIGILCTVVMYIMSCTQMLLALWELAEGMTVVLETDLLYKSEAATQCIAKV